MYRDYVGLYRGGRKENGRGLGAFTPEWFIQMKN